MNSGVVRLSAGGFGDGDSCGVREAVARPDDESVEGVLRVQPRRLYLKRHGTGSAQPGGRGGPGISVAVGPLRARRVRRPLPRSTVGRVAATGPCPAGDCSTGDGDLGRRGPELPLTAPRRFNGPEPGVEHLFGELIGRREDKRCPRRSPTVGSGRIPRSAAAEGSAPSARLSSAVVPRGGQRWRGPGGAVVRTNGWARPGAPRLHGCLVGKLWEPVSGASDTLTTPPP